MKSDVTKLVVCNIYIIPIEYFQFKYICNVIFNGTEYKDIYQ